MPLSPPPQSFYQNASNFTIGTQNLTIHHGPSNSAHRIGRIELPHAILDASHNRNRKTSPPDSSCLPGTREVVITKILSWAANDEDDHGQVILWLCGSVGSGKSAILQAVAERLDGCHRLAASFFFFRGSGDRSRFARFVMTLASQIAVAIPETAPYIMEALEKMGGWSVSKQMEVLVYRPIELALADKGCKEPVSIAIDGLDECQDQEEVAEFIDHALDYFAQNPHLPIRFIIASRIEQHIQARLETESVQIENLAEYLAPDDIRTFLRASFSRAARQSRVIRAYGQWPTVWELETLLEHIDGSFIFASTIVKYILGTSDDGLTPMERLPLALEMNPGLDGLYTETFKRCCHFPHFTDILAILALSYAPLSISEFSTLLGTPTFKILNILLNLQTIIHVPGDDRSPVTIFHTSLRDYLTTESRSGPFFISPTYHQQLTLQWLQPIPNTVCCSAVPDTPVSLMPECERMPRAIYHWKKCMATYEDSPDLQVLRFFEAFAKHWFPSCSLGNGDCIPWEANDDPFYCSIFMLMDNFGHALFGSSSRLCVTVSSIVSAQPLHIPYSGNVASILVHTGMRFFNGSTPFENASEAGKHMLCYWVKYLAAAVDGDHGLTLEFLQRRCYGPFAGNMMDLRFRSRECSISLDSRKAIKGLKDDVLAAQKAIETRFPGTLRDLGTTGDLELHFKAAFHNGQRLEGLEPPEISDVGISVLDVFSAYRDVTLMGATPLEEIFVLDEPSHFDITFTHEGRNHLRHEIRFRRPGPAKKKRPVYITFNLDYHVYWIKLRPIGAGDRPVRRLRQATRT